jgi:hypothetical protein
MEQAPADARAASTVAEPTNMDTTEGVSPKRPRETAQGNKVSEGATKIHAKQPETREPVPHAKCCRTA